MIIDEYFCLGVDIDVGAVFCKVVDCRLNISMVDSV